MAIKEELPNELPAKLSCDDTGNRKNFAELQQQHWNTVKPKARVYYDNCTPEKFVADASLQQ